MQNHYINIHWPPRPPIQMAPERWVYLQRHRDLQSGDLALIYETKNNPSRVANGKYLKMTGKGRGGIVAAVELTEKPQLAPDITSDPDQPVVLTEQVIDDGRLIQWRYIARTKPIKEGFLSLSDIRRLLDKPRWNPRIRGGLTAISRPDFERLFENIA